MIESINRLIEWLSIFVSLPDVLLSLLPEIERSCGDIDRSLLHESDTEPYRVWSLLDRLYIPSVGIYLIDTLRFWWVRPYRCCFRESQLQVSLWDIWVHHSFFVDEFIEYPCISVLIECDEWCRVVGIPEVLTVCDEFRLLWHGIDIEEVEYATFEPSVLSLSVDLPIYRVYLLYSLDFLDCFSIEERIVSIGGYDSVHISFLESSLNLQFLIYPDILIIRIEVDEDFVPCTHWELSVVLPCQLIRFIAVENITTRSTSLLRIIDTYELDNAVLVLVCLLAFIDLYLVPEVLLRYLFFEVSLYTGAKICGILTNDREDSLIEESELIYMSSDEPVQKKTDKATRLTRWCPPSVYRYSRLALVVLQEQRSRFDLYFHVALLRYE